MPTWDELFRNKEHILRFPQPEATKFIQRLETAFDQRPLEIWDLCCGAGRHSITISQMGHQAFATDISPTGTRNLSEWAAELQLQCKTAVCDMSINPWPAGQKFHGILCWDALHHNTIENIAKTVRMARQALVSGGLFMVSLISVKSGTGGKGRLIEKNTFVQDDGLESGVPHHYFDESEVRVLFAGWSIRILAEVIVNYVETEPEFYRSNPFPYTKWNVLVRKEP